MASLKPEDDKKEEPANNMKGGALANNEDIESEKAQRFGKKTYDQMLLIKKTYD